jgi:hypothetical protein
MVAVNALMAIAAIKNKRIVLSFVFWQLIKALRRKGPPPATFCGSSPCIAINMTLEQ